METWRGLRHRRLAGAAVPVTSTLRWAWTPAPLSGAAPCHPRFHLLPVTPAPSPPITGWSTQITCLAAVLTPEVVGFCRNGGGPGAKPHVSVPQRLPGRLEDPAPLLGLLRPRDMAEEVRQKEERQEAERAKARASKAQEKKKAEVRALQPMFFTASECCNLSFDVPGAWGHANVRHWAVSQQGPHTCMFKDTVYLDHERAR